MKAYSVGPETKIQITSFEIDKLKDSKIEGILKFRECQDNSLKKEIPFNLNYDKSQKELLNVKIIPKKSYFGDADKIIYTINEDLYKELVVNGFCCDRFLVSGKLLIFAENIK